MAERKAPPWYLRPAVFVINEVDDWFYRAPRIKRWKDREGIADAEHSLVTTYGVTAADATEADLKRVARESWKAYTAAKTKRSKSRHLNVWRYVSAVLQIEYSTRSFYPRGGDTYNQRIAAVYPYLSPASRRTTLRHMSPSQTEAVRSYLSPYGVKVCDTDARAIARRFALV